MGAPIVPLAAPNTHCGIEGGYGERMTTRARDGVRGFEGSRVRGFDGSGVRSPRRDHRPLAGLVTSKRSSPGANI